MEQIQIRQPKIPVAQSFIQILETFFHCDFIIYSKNFLILKKIIQLLNSLKVLQIQGLPIESNYFAYKKNFLKCNKFKNFNYIIIFY